MKTTEMKTIIIEPVTNGWIVSRHYACMNTSPGPLAVYNNIADLQAALPALLGAVQNVINAPPFPHAALGYTALQHINPPPLAARDSEGENTQL